MCLTIPAKVISKKANNKVIIDFNNRKEEADARLVDVRVGDYVLVSNGYIIQKIEAKEAERIFKILKIKAPNKK